MEKIKRNCFIILFLLVVSGLSAQVAKSYQITQKSEKGTPSAITFDATTDITHQTFFDNLKDEFNFQSDDKFTLIKTSKDKVGFTHYKYSQKYKNITVYGVEFIIHEKSVVISANGKFIPNLSINTTPSITKDEAVKKAMKELNLGKYRWEDESSEKALKEKTSNPKATHYPKPTLVIAPMNGNYSGEFHLCWKFNISGLKATDEWIVFIEAHNGKLVNKISGVNKDVTGSLGTYYYGTQTMQVYLDTNSATYYLTELQTRGPNHSQQIIDINANHTALSSLTATPITDNSLSFSAYPVAVGAHWAIEKSYDFFYSRYGRNSYDNSGSWIKVASYYHDPADLNNAFFLDADSTMFFGDGDSANTNLGEGAQSALDVAGHELYHAYTRHSSNLTYQGESGALNESFSDIMGTGVKYSVFGAQSDLWLFSANTFVIAGGYSRSLSDPKSRQQPTTYLSLANYWVSTDSVNNDNGGVHTNSGVQNYWFYLLCQGGSGTNDNGTSYSVTGVGIDTALEIAFYNNTYNLTPSSTYNDAMLQSVQTAINLHGPTSPIVQSVKDAWCAVGLNCNATAINNIADNFSVSVYPNPSNGKVNILNNSKMSELNIKVINVMGQELRNYNINNYGETQLDLSQLANGVYFLRIGNNNNFMTKQLILNY